MDFDPTHQYGDYVVIGVEGEHSELDDVVRNKAVNELAKHFAQVVPFEYHCQIDIIEQGPVWIENPFEPPGADNGNWTITLAWKYTPAKMRVRR